MTDPAARWLPPGFPIPAPEQREALRQGIMAATRTAYPPEPAELAAAIAADEAGIALGELDPAALWALPPAERAPLFAALARLLGELA